jgi:hypothetical protein
LHKNIISCYSVKRSCFLFFLYLLSISAFGQIKQLPIPVKINVPNKDSIINTSRYSDFLKAKKAEMSKNIDSLSSRKHYYGVFRRSLNNILQVKVDTNGKVTLPPMFKAGSGSASITHQQAQRSGNYPNNSPATFTRLQLSGGIEVLSLPLRVQTLLTTEQTEDRQPMNRYSVSLDAAVLRKRALRQIDQEIKGIEKMPGFEDIKKMDQLYNNIKEQDLSLEQEDIEAYKEHFLTKGENMAQQYVKESEAELKKKAISITDSLTNEAKAAGTKAQKKALKKLKDKSPEELEKISGAIKTVDSLETVMQDKMKLYHKLKSLKEARAGNLEELKKYTSSKGRLGKLASTINAFSIGTNNPVYTPFTLGGVPVTGLYVEAQPHIFYAAFTTHKNLNELPGEKALRRNLTAARAGVGAKESTHLHFIYLQAADDRNSFRPDTMLTGVNDTLVINTPRSNHVVSADFKADLLNKKISFEGELASSLTKENSLLSPTSFTDIISNLGKTTLSENNNSQSDYAYRLQANLNLVSHSRLVLKKETIGAGYYSLGVPFLRNNVSMTEVRTEHQLFKNRIIISPSYSVWKEDIKSNEENTSDMNVYTLAVKTSFPKLPIIGITLRQNFIYNAVSKQKQNTMAAFAAYNYKIHKTSLSTNIVFNAQDNLVSGEYKSNYDLIRTVNLTQVIAFSLPLTIKSTVTYIQRNTKDIKDIPSLLITGIHEGRNIGFNNTVAYTFWGRWQNTAGYGRMVSESEGYKNTGFFESSLNIRRYYAISLRSEYTLCRSNNESLNYEEKLGRIVLSARF